MTFNKVYLIRLKTMVSKLSDRENSIFIFRPIIKNNVLLCPPKEFNGRRMTCCVDHNFVRNVVFIICIRSYYKGSDQQGLTPKI